MTAKYRQKLAQSHYSLTDLPRNWLSLIVILVLALGSNFPRVALAQSGTKDLGGGGDPYVDAFMEKAKKTAIWLESHTEIIDLAQIRTYQQTVAYLELGTQKGHINRVKFTKRKPRDHDGNLKPAIFILKPYREIHIHKKTWRAWNADAYVDFYNIYLQVNLEMLGLARVPEGDRYNLALAIAEYWMDIEKISLVKPSLQKKLGVTIWKENFMYEPARFVVDGTPGQNKSIWPPRTFLATPFGQIYKAFNNFRIAEIGQLDQTQIENSDANYISLSVDKNNDLIITFNSAFFDTKKDAPRLVLAALKSEFIQLKFSKTEENLTKLELLPSSFIFGSMVDFEQRWIESPRKELAYTFKAEVKDEFSIFIFLRLFSPQHPKEYIDFKVQYSQLHEDEPAWFDISFDKQSADLTADPIRGSYGSSCLRGIPPSYIGKAYSECNK